MPELPDIEAYVVALRKRIVGSRLERIEILHPFLLRSVGTDPNDGVGRECVAVERLGKRIVLECSPGPFYVFHLMIAGRFKWKEGPQTQSASRRSKSGPLARISFESGILTLTEAGTKRRASLHVAKDREELAQHDPGGRELLDGTMSESEFAALLRRENHTIKRSLTDPRLFSGIGNSYSDEILFAAKQSPFMQTGSMSDEQIATLYAAAQATLATWRDRLVSEAEAKFPAKVTAFRPEMYVHGRYDEPCRECGTKVQRIRYAENECNYCPTCQSDGKLYADRALSRLLKGDWPRTVTELEELKSPRS